MRRRWAALATAMALVAIPLSVGALPDSYSAEEIRGWVVDAETKQPLEGAHVVAQWILDTGMFFHSERVQRLHVMETLTDAKGEYYFPAWGPKPRPVLGQLDYGADPWLTFFKPGYRMLNRGNAGPPHANAVRTSRWHLKTIALDPFRGTPAEWADELWKVQSRIDWGRPTGEFPRRINDLWKYVPRVVLAITQQRRMLPESVRHHVWDLASWNVTEAEVRALVEKGGTTR